MVSKKMTSQVEPLLLTERKDNLIYLIFNRPAVLNALSLELLLVFKEELRKIRDDPEIQAVIITGAGDRAFSAGADITFLHQASSLEIRNLAQLAVSVTRIIENLNKITLALINGFALGGGLEIAESCMLRIAAQSAKLGHPEVRIGAVAGWGGTTRLPRLIGKARATEMLLTGQIIGAEEACKLGLVNQVAEAGTLHEVGEKLLSEILNNAPVAVNLTWEALHRGLDLSIDESAQLGADYFGLVSTTRDFRNGTRAFLEKQKTQFTGK